MRSLRHHLTLLASLVAVALFAAQATTASAVVVSVAAALIVVAVAARSVVAAGRRVMTVGSRARAHREPLSFEPAPAHPRTAGRIRSRAPSAGVLAA